ncbi:MAG: hypothetical protein HN793_15235 [Rhodospirillaceae bacterium]|jgi:deoxycytidylate deaminase|nr:hypothetical protein [Rhodospirillaceae bacterium]
MTIHTCKLLNLAGNAALLGKTKSNMVYQHGAVIVKNGKPVCMGFNHKRSYSNGTLCCSFHAEFDAEHKWKSIFLKGKRNKDDIQRLARKFDIYVVRLANGSDGYLDSMPCHNCVKKLKKTGFKNIYYSTDGGGFKKVKIRDIVSDHHSDAQINLNQYISYKHKL